MLHLAYPLARCNFTPAGLYESTMEASSLQSLIRFNCNFSSRSFVDMQRHGRISAKEVDRNFASLAVCKVPRRMVLEFVGFNAMLSYFQPAVAAPMPEMKEAEIIRTQKLPSGVRIQDIVEGKGAEARQGDLVEINYVCRRSNGYFVHSTVDQFSGESSPVRLPLDEKQIIKGLKEVLIGMRVGGKRRALIPPSVGYVNENLKPIPEEFGPRRSLLSHADEPLVFEPFKLKFVLVVCEMSRVLGDFWDGFPSP